MRSTISQVNLLAWMLLLGHLLSLVGARSTATADGNASNRLRVLCYNIHHGEGTDRRIDLDRLAGVISSAEPDLVALQEVDDRTGRTGGVDQIARLAELTGMQGRFAHQIDFEGGRYGQAFLSRFPLSEVTIDWLPGVPERERRIAASVRIEWNNQPLTFVSTHLHHVDARLRSRQATALNQTFGDREELVILAGDLNATPRSAPLQILSRRWSSATAGQQRLTFPATAPERQLDYILYRPSGRLAVEQTQVLDEPLASDHRPLLVEFKLTTAVQRPAD